MRRLLTVPLEIRSRYRLDPQVAIRPETFGALAYHHGSRRLTFLRSQLLAELVRDLHLYETVEQALADRVPYQSRRSYTRALTSLADSHFIEVTGAG